MNANFLPPIVSRRGPHLFWLFLALLIMTPATMGMIRAAEPLPYLAQWGSWGSGPGQFLYPYDVAVDTQGNVYVVDLAGTVQKFDSRGVFLSKWGSPGSGAGQFDESQSIAVDQNGNVYVADSGNHRIQKFDSSGNFLAAYGSHGNGNGQFDFPTGVATDLGGNVFVVDAGNHRVVKLSDSGGFLLAWGGLGTGGEDGQFNGPRRVAVDGAGHVYVTDQGNRRIQKFDSSGNFLAKWGSAGSATGQFEVPMGITADGSGNVYVTEWSTNHRIQKFDSNGAFLSQWGSLGNGNGQFDDPYGVAVASNGNVYVADTTNSRIQIFGKDSTQHLYLPIVSGEQSSATPTPTPSVTPSPTSSVTPSPTPTSSVTPAPTPSTTPSGLICNASGGFGGLAPGTKIETTFNDYPLVIQVSQSYRPDVPGFLSIYLHGDEGNHKVGIAPVDGGVYVAPQAPATDGAFHQWYALPEQNTAFLVSLFEDLFSKYNLCRNVIFGGSASGGSVFYDRTFYPTQGGTYPAFWNVNCGGGLSSDAEIKLQALSQQPGIVARSEFSYTIGTADFLFTQTSASADYRKSLGFHVVKNYLAGVGHCAYNVPQTVGKYFQSKLIQMNATVNRPPIANDDFVGAVSGRSSLLDVLANDTDPNSDALHLAAVSNSSLGIVSIQGNHLAYTPTVVQAGQDVFTYTVSDGKDGLSTASVTVDVQPNGPPLPRNDAFVVPINSSANLLDVLYNDLDPNEAETLTLTAVSAPAHGAISLSNGALFYTPTVAFTGTEVLTYSVSDPGGATAQAVVTLTVGATGKIVVNTTTDELNSDGDCSLREAIQSANNDVAVDGCSAGQGVDTIYLPSGFYQVALIINETSQQPAGESDNASGDFDILNALTIQGATAGSTIVDGNQIDRVFHVARPNLAVTLRDLTIQNGLARPQASQWFIEPWGGGVAVYPTQITNSNAGSLTLERTVVRNNTADAGAGILTYRGSLLLTNSSVISNSYSGVATLHQMSVINSTFVGNGIEFAGNSGSVENSTVDIRNTKDVQGIFAWTGTVTVRNSVFTGDAQSLNCSVTSGAGAIVSAGYNVSSNTSCPFTQPSDKKSQAVDLAGLAAFGGTPSLAPRFGSPLRNAIPGGVNGCGAEGSVDQRGVSRPQGSGCEIGAHEVLALPANR